MNYIITETEKEEFESFLKMKKDCMSQMFIWYTPGGPMSNLKFYSKDETVELLKKEIEHVRELNAVLSNKISVLESKLQDKKKSTWF